MKFTKKLIAAILVLTLMLSAVAALANVKFTGSAYGYEKKGKVLVKTKYIIKKGSVAEETGNTFKSKTEVYLPNGKALYFPSKYLKDTTKEAHIVFAAGGSGMSERDTDSEEAYKTSYKKVKATGKVNIRKYPSLEGKSQGVLRVGKTLKYTGYRYQDSRGVYFYGVKYNGKTCYVSAEYTKLVK